MTATEQIILSSAVVFGVIFIAIYWVLVIALARLRKKESRAELKANFWRAEADGWHRRSMQWQFKCDEYALENQSQKELLRICKEVYMIFDKEYLYGHLSREAYLNSEEKNIFAEWLEKRK